MTLADSALECAAAIDAAVARGQDVGPLAGVPVSIKDTLWMRGALATNGSLALRDFVPDRDCVPVARIRAAGATIVGKTNNPEFCYRGYTDNALWGVTRNPWNRERTPGGSSGGAGASVAAGMTPMAVGTDGGGSVRIPASYCGLVGVKPTFGLVPKEPGFPGWKTLSIIGPLTRTVRDAAALLEVMAGVDPGDDMSYPGGDREFCGRGRCGFSGRLAARFVGCPGRLFRRRRIRRGRSRRPSRVRSRRRAIRRWGRCDAEFRRILRPATRLRCGS